jgi:hypothetical protein
MSIRGLHKLNAKLEYLGARRLEREELVQIQRFHRGILCWEAETLLSPKNLPPIDPVDKAAWVDSSNGLLYLLMPLHPLDIPAKEHVASCEYVPPLDWLEHLTAAADGAQELITNMIIQKQRYIEQGAMLNSKLSVNGEGDKRFKNVYRGPYTPESLQGMVLSIAPHSLYIGVKSEKRKTLMSVMNPATDDTKTFYDHFIKEGSTPRADLDRIVADPTQHLVRALAVNGKLDAAALLGRVLYAPGDDNMSPDNNRIDSSVTCKLHRHSYMSYLLPEFCTPLGRAEYYFTGLIAPCLMWRVQSIFSAIELRTSVGELYREWKLTHPGLNMLEDDLDVTSSSSMVPGIMAHLEASTPRMCVELIDSERLEM